MEFSVIVTIATCEQLYWFLSNPFIAIKIVVVFVSCEQPFNVEYSRRLFNAVHKMWMETFIQGTIFSIFGRLIQSEIEEKSTKTTHKGNESQQEIR